MAYTLEQFCADCSATLKKDDTHTGRQRIKGLLEKLLAERAFVDKYCGPDAAPGVHTLYKDPETGVHVLAHIYDKPRVSPPHDHGESWAIYGQAIAHTDMTDWQLTGTNAERERYDGCRGKTRRPAEPSKRITEVSPDAVNHRPPPPGPNRPDDTQDDGGGRKVRG